MYYQTLDCKDFGNYYWAYSFSIKTYLGTVINMDLLQGFSVTIYD
jgi:hypothetical protein